MGKPYIAVPIGDPAGVGPEIVVKSVASKEVFDVARTVVIGDAKVLANACKIMNVDLRINKIEKPEGISNLKDIKIESSDINVDEWALEGTAYYNEPSNWDNGVLYVDKHVLVAKEDVLKGDYVIKEGTKSISIRAFSGCNKLTKITVPKGVTRIPENAFASCENLKSVVLASGVKSVDFCAFEYCENLKDITLPDTIEWIGDRAFSGTAYYNNEKNWGNGVLYIGNYLIEVNENFKEKNYTVKCEWNFASINNPEDCPR